MIEVLLNKITIALYQLNRNQFNLKQFSLKQVFIIMKENLMLLIKNMEIRGQLLEIQIWKEASIEKNMLRIIGLQILNLIDQR